MIRSLRVSGKFIVSCDIEINHYMNQIGSYRKRELGGYRMLGLSRGKKEANDERVKKEL